MQIFADEDGPLAGSMEKMLAPIGDRNGVTVFLERKVLHGFRQELHGLDDVLQHAESGAPIVMFAWQSPVMLADDPRFHAALGYPNVVFRRLPEGIVEIMAALDEAAEQKRTPDPLAIALLTAEVKVREIQILNHDLSGAERSPERMIMWLERARKYLGDKTQEELIAIVKQPREEKSGANQFVGQIFPDVCVDVEGTLFTDDGVFQPSILASAELLAAEERRPITVWSGGDLSKIQEQVRKVGIPHKLTSKESLRGAKVGVIIDNMTPGAFSETYSIQYDDYRQV